MTPGPVGVMEAAEIGTITRSKPDVQAGDLGRVPAAFTSMEDNYWRIDFIRIHLCSIADRS
jgi:hypothetical protein